MMGFSFLDVCNASISASWLVLVVLILRLLLKKAPKAIHCALWTLVAFRLLCPVSIESPWSLMPSGQTVSGYYLTEEGAFDTARTVLEVVDNPLYPEAELVVDLEASRVSVLDVQWTAVVWPAGMAVMAGYALASWVRLRKKVAASIRIASNIRICDAVDSPFILGLVRPVIYLPSDLDQWTLDHVLAHENAHLARRDHWWKPLGFALLTIHWFNPVIWLAYFLLCRDIELACDERVIRDLGAEQKKAYSAALLRCSVSRSVIAACPLAFGEVGVKERVKTVLNYKKPAFWIIVLAVILCVIAAVGFLTDPVEEPLVAEGTYLSQEKVHWAWHSSLYVEGISMNVVDGTVTVEMWNNDHWYAGPFDLSGDWTAECPIPEDQRSLLDELADIEPSFRYGEISDCRFLVLDENHFLAKDGEALYLVSWKHSGKSLEIVDYIFRMVPEAEYTDPSHIVLGTATLDADATDEYIYRYFLEACTPDYTDNVNAHTSISFKQYGTAYHNADHPISITKNLNLRIAHYLKGDDGTITETDAETFPVILSMNEHEDGSYEITDCIRDTVDYPDSAFYLEAECWRQAYAHYEPDLQAQIAALYEEHPEYFSKDITNGLDLVWWNTQEGVRCVVLSGIQRARTSSDAKIHAPLTVQETIALLEYYNIPLQAMLGNSTSALAIWHIDPP